MYEDRCSWYTDREFWLTFAPVLFGSDRWNAAPVEVDRIIRLLGLRGGDRLLDACCGVGRHSVEFAGRGLVVTGVDRMAEYLEAAGETAGAEEVDVEFLETDLRAFKRASSFDVAVSLFISVGYFEDLEDEILVFRNIGESLKPGGRFLVDTIGREILRKQFTPKDWYRADGVFVVSQYRAEKDYSRLWNRWILYDDAGRHEYSFSHRVFGADELAELLVSAGFSSVDVYGDLDGSPYGPEAERLVAVAVR